MTAIDYLRYARVSYLDGDEQTAQAAALIVIAEELRKLNDRDNLRRLPEPDLMQWWDVTATYPSGHGLVYTVRATSEQGAVDQVMERETVDHEATFTAVVAR